MRRLMILMILVLSVVLLSAFATADGEIQIALGQTDTDNLYETIAGVENSGGTDGTYVWHTTSQTVSQKGFSFSSSTLSNISFNWIYLFGSTNLSLGDDEVSGLISLGFNTNFYGTSYSQVRVSSNGFLTFDDDSNHGCCEGQLLPTSGSPANLVVGWWEDLRPASGGGAGTIKYETIGSAPNRKFVVEFNDVAHYGDNNKRVTFQIVLKEN